MLRIILVSLIILMSISCMTVLYMKHTTSDPKPESKLSNAEKGFKDVGKSLPDVVNEINARNQATQSISCTEMDIKIWSGGHRYKLTGSLHYKKPQLFRMSINSLLGQEVDIGSNDKYFWYWSRRDKSPGLYYAKHEDFAKTRLKTPFNPMFLSSSLGADVLPAKDCKVLEKGDNYMLVYPRQSASGQPILFAIFVNKTRKQIDGYIVTDSRGQTLVTCDIQEYNGGIPSKVLYTWHEENHVMLLSFKRVKLNPAINASVWDMPNHKPKKNMAEN